MKYSAVLIFLLGAFVAAAAAALPTPAVTVFPATFYPLENLLFIEGTAPPQSTVEIILRQHEERFITLRTKSDNRGVWSLAERLFLEEGRWEVRARATSGDEVSRWSEPVVITSVITGIGFGRFSITYPVAAGILVFILFLGGGAFAYLTIRVRHVRRDLLKKEAHEVRHKVTQGFHAVRSGIIDELRSLEAQAKGGHLDTEMLVRQERLLQDLHALEEDLEREAEDVEKLT